MAVSEKTIVNRIVKKYGEVIDLRKSPEAMIEILRTFAPMLENGGLPPGGTPPPPPGPAQMREEATLDDVLREVLRISRQVRQLEKRLGS